jgi:O-antigen ligase
MENKKNLRPVIAALFAVFFISLQFDNAIFHIANLLVLLCVLYAFSATERATIIGAFRDYRATHLGFLAILLLMVVVNLANAQSDTAWRVTSVFAFRYWLNFALLIYLLHSGLLSTRWLLICLSMAVALPLLPLLPAILGGEVFDERFQGVTRNPNVVGLYLGFGVLLGIDMLSRARPALSYLSMILAALMTLACLVLLLASGSRASWVGLVAGIGVFLLFDPRFTNKSRLVVIVSMSVLAALVFSMGEMPTRRLGLLVDGYSAQRSRIWMGFYELFKVQPFFGHGMDTKTLLREPTGFYSAHNIFFSVILSLGLVGLAAYLYLLKSIIWPAWQNKAFLPLALMAYLLTTGQFGFDFYDDQHFMTWFVTISALCLFVARQNQAES